MTELPRHNAMAISTLLGESEASAAAAAKPQHELPTPQLDRKAYREWAQERLAQAATFDSQYVAANKRAHALDMANRARNRASVFDVYSYLALAPHLAARAAETESLESAKGGQPQLKTQKCDSGPASANSVSPSRTSAKQPLSSRRKRRAATVKSESTNAGTDGSEQTPKRLRKLESKHAASKSANEAANGSSNATTAQTAGSSKRATANAKHFSNVYDGIWRDIARREVAKAFKIYQNALAVRQQNARKTAGLASKESRRWQLRTNKSVKDMQSKGRRTLREMLALWRRNERSERDQRRTAEKEALENARKEEEQRESTRQARKLNFLITQTELYSHFVGSKMASTSDGDPDVATETEQSEAPTPIQLPPDMKVDPSAQKTSAKAIDFDNLDEEALEKTARDNAASAVNAARQRAKAFDGVKSVNIDDEEMNFSNPTSLGDMSLGQPNMLSCKLKEYQLKGLNWLANLYEQGINGILADEMGLGKTVQSISVMAYLAEVHDIWGPFLVVAPASTLHNWQQEITRFVPDFKVLPYWGNNKDRKVLRKFWDRKQLRYTKDAPFHVLVTSYQLVVADAQYFNRIKWQYMILDEAQAIKSSNSSRWKSLLSMQCRNRLLLTGTPIQNSMQELWALLHFIMPTLFDSHEEFSDWFSKDIESHAQKNSQLNEQQLKRLHMILKPFMLRRVKRNVQQELGDKIEVDVYCKLSRRQRELYQQLRSQVSLKDLILESTKDDNNQALMNLVMQFRKVCNHPDLFERLEARSPLALNSFGDTFNLARDGAVVDLRYSSRSLIHYKLPKTVYREGLVLELDSVECLKRKIQNKLSIYEEHHGYLDSVATVAGVSPQEARKLSRMGIFERALTRYSVPDLFPQKTEPLYSVASAYASDHYLNIMQPLSFSTASAPPIELWCPDRSCTQHQEELLRPQSMRVLFPLTLNQEWRLIQSRSLANFPPSNLLPSLSHGSYSPVQLPSVDQFVCDSGKLSRLDSLLKELKAGGHRVLIYFQMTRMMDLMEDFLTFRQYKHIRLDGSSKLSDRRDLVNDWQTKPDIFVFLLSTRAGGLGINLTAADTVIFYDSDWNPTMDSQAMDRAHRLGQTRQVTVYRLLVKGTIEERMRDRAKQKEHVQQVVMEGRGQRAEFKKANREVAYWLLDDDDLADSIIQDGGDTTST